MTSAEPLCNQKVKELRELAKTNGLDVKEGKKNKKKCELLIELVNHRNKINEPSVEVENPQLKFTPNSKKNKRVTFEETEPENKKVRKSKKDKKTFGVFESPEDIKEAQEYISQKLKEKRDKKRADLAEKKKKALEEAKKVKKVKKTKDKRVWHQAELLENQSDSDEDDDILYL